MGAQVLSVVATGRADGDGRVSATVVATGEAYPVYAASTDVELSLTWDALLPLVLLPAMRRGLDIAAEGSLSARLASSLPTIQDVFATWYPWLKRVAVHGAELTDLLPEPGRRI